jgi:hypothetical protein
MRIGMLVDGQAEFRAMPLLIPRIDSPHTLLSPLYADIQPNAPISQVVGAVRCKLPILAAHRADALVVLVDREQRPDCPGELAAAVEQELLECCTQAGVGTVGVVIKNRMFENWLVADTRALGQMRKRFAFPDRAFDQIRGRADSVDAADLLKRHAAKRAYDKISDAMKVLHTSEPLRMAENSRSFRRFLRRLECPLYREQSRRFIPLNSRDDG